MHQASAPWNARSTPAPSCDKTPLGSGQDPNLRDETCPYQVPHWEGCSPWHWPPSVQPAELHHCVGSGLAHVANPELGSFKIGEWMTSIRMREKNGR